MPADGSGRSSGPPNLFHAAVQAPPPLVVLLADLTANRRWWDPLLDALDAIGTVSAQVVPLDLRGRGDAIGRGAAAAPADHVSDVDAAIAAVRGPGPRPVVLVGHGFGARIAAIAAADSGVSAIVAVDGPRAPHTAEVGTSARIAMIDETAVRLHVTYPHRDAYLAYWRSQPWFGAAGVSRRARDALVSDLGGSGFGWRPRIGAEAVAADVAQWATPTLPLPGAVAARSVVIVADGPPDGDAPGILEDLGIPDRRRIAADHVGLLFGDRPVAAVAAVIAEVIAQVATLTA